MQPSTAGLRGRIGGAWRRAATSAGVLAVCLGGPHAFAADAGTQAGAQAAGAATTATAPVAVGTTTLRAAPDARCVPSAASPRQVTRDIAYADAAGGDPKRRSLDVYTLAGARDCPVMIWVHGGSWVRGDKSNLRTLPAVLGREGFILAAVNYRFPPAVTFDGQAADVAAAIAWVHAHIADRGGDPRNIVLIGHSAGAHLISLVATDASYLRAQGLAPSVLRGVVSLEGDYDLRLLASGTPPRVPDLYLAPFTADPANWWRASPLGYVARDAGIPPFVLV